MPRERFSNEPFRLKFLEMQKKEDLTLAEIATRIGWETKDRKSGEAKPDSSRVGRTLGLVKENGACRQFVSYDNAVLLCQALHVDYHEIGV